MGHCNNIIIEMKDYLIVVDANFPSGARLALEAREESVEKAREICLRHPPSRRSRLRKPGLDEGRRNHTRPQGSRRRDEALRAGALAGNGQRHERTWPS